MSKRNQWIVGVNAVASAIENDADNVREVLVEGGKRARISGFKEVESHFEAFVEPLPDRDGDAKELEALGEYGVRFEPMQASYFLGRETLVAASAPRMTTWQQWLFSLMSRNAMPATEFFRIPSDRVVELGVRVAI